MSAYTQMTDTKTEKLIRNMFFGENLTELEIADALDIPVEDIRDILAKEPGKDRC